VMLQDGAVVERGRPADLLARDGKFAAFWRTQHAAVADDSETHGGVLQGDQPR
jgi:ATP-binding cassette, subfamily B, bacterial IrtA/YbtP